MLDKLLGYRVHYYLHILGFFILCFGIPLNKVLMSIGTIWCISNLLLEGNFKVYWNNLKSSKIFILLFVLILFHFVGLLYSSNLEYGLHDLRVKLPLFVIPLVYIAKPIEAKELNVGLTLFCTCLVLASSLNFYQYVSDFDNGEVKDVREMSRFGSHIRFSLFIAFGAAIALLKTIQLKKYFWIWGLLFAWFSFYTLKSQVFGGMIAYLVMLAGLFIYALFKIKTKWLKASLLITFLAITCLGAFAAFHFFKPEELSINATDLDEFTAEGNPYKHDLNFMLYENGNPVLIYVAEKELRRDWPKNSNLNLDSLDAKGQKTLFTLLRFLTSKNLRKDAQGLSKLSAEEIHFIEQGIPSETYLKKGVMQRLYSLKYQIQHYKYGLNPSGSSLLQRFEHWRIGAHIIKNNWLIGTGTGDIQDEFNTAYKDLNSQLEKEYWNRTHNQFMTIWITFGIFGFLAFILIWFFLLKEAIHLKNLIAFCFGLIAIASFLPEDTIETQQGVTFIALFLGVFVGNMLLKKKEKSL